MWTEQQQKAIDLEGNLLVSAAAGAGKTAVMTERIVRIISEGTKAEELLVVTFTRPAAAEMKQRIEKRLTELSECETDPEKRRLLNEAAVNISRANISTIHSFCANVLKRNYNRVGLDPAYRVADDAEAQLLINEVLGEVMEEFCQSAEKEKDEPSRFLLRALGKNDALKEAVLALYYFAVARPDPVSWLFSASEGYGSEFEKASERAASSLIASARRNIGVFYSYASELYEKTYEVTDEKTEGFRAVLQDDMSRLMEFLNLDSYDGWQMALDGFVLRPLTGMGKAPESIKKYREELKKLINELKALFPMPLCDEKRLALALHGAVYKLCSLTAAFMERYNEYKLRDSLIDFSDMEQLTFEALKNDDTAEEYREKFRYIFVDEYQDTNLVQDSIISRISRGNNLFMVGDVKQSIYRFRQAEPKSFIEKYRSYDGTAGTRIDLNCNFRSTTSVLNAANALFSKLMLGEIGEIDYSDNAELKPSDGAASGSVELILSELSQEYFENAETDGENAEGEEQAESADTGADELENIEAEAFIAAERIKALLETETVFDKDLGRRRQLRFSDIAILLRRTKGPALRLINALNEKGIPCQAELGDGYFDAIEVQIFMNLLRVIDNSRQDIPLVSVLRSPIGGFTDKELVFIRTEFREESYIDCLRCAAKAFENGECDERAAEKASGFLKKISEYKALSQHVGMEELIGRLYDETRYHTLLGALPGGGVRRANLDLLTEKARAFEKNGMSGLHRFIVLMDSVRDNTNMGAAQAASVNAVRVMSIHKSKGLEFPIVFICGLTGQFSTREKRGAIVLDNDLGIGFRIARGFERLTNVEGIDPGLAEKPLLRRAVEAKESSKQAAEEMRVLYVAMTRARERLYLLGAKKNMPAFVKKRAFPLSDYRIMNARSYLDWMLGAYFPFGLDLERAKEGIRIPVYSDSLLTRFISSKSGGEGRLRLDKNAFSRWIKRAESAEHAALDERLSFDYKFAEDTLIPAKSTVTAKMETGEYVPAVPAFTESENEGKISGAERGTLTHRFIMLLPLEPLDESALERILQNLTEKGVFTENERKAIDLTAVSRLVSSPLYSRMLASKTARREQEFSVFNEKGALEQGVADCYFIENGEIVLIDYKTTSVRNRDPFEVARSYSPQLDSYQRALEKLTGLKVKEKYVWLLSASMGFRLD